MAHLLSRSLRAAPLLLVFTATGLPMLTSRAEDPPKPPVQGSDPQKERAARDAAYKSLYEELKAVIEEYSKVLQDSQRRGIPRDQWPRNPSNDFFPRFEALAMQDQPDSLRWCIGVITSIDFTLDERISKKDALYKRYVASCLDSSFTADIIQFLSMDANPDGLGIDRSTAFLDQIAKGASSGEIRLKATWAKAQAFQRGTAPEHKEKYLATLKDIVRLYPSSNEGLASKGLLYQLEFLQVGQPAPEVEAVDVDGKAFKLSASRGKVTVVAFFAFAHRSGVPFVASLKEQCASLAGKPFEIVGVTLDEKKDDFKTALAAAGVDWKIAWQDGRKGTWVTQWGVNRLPTVYVIDDLGVIRATNLEPSAIRSLVEQLLAEKDARNKPKVEKKEGDK